jgi:hypothetical protein
MAAPRMINYALREQNRAFCASRDHVRHEGRRRFFALALCRNTGADIPDLHLSQCVRVSASACP